MITYRYYGESHPTADTSLPNLAFLSSRQALRDVVTFKQYIVDQMKMSYKNRWISFGGSYSGALSAWLRVFYHYTVSGAVATSGPVKVGVAINLKYVLSSCVLCRLISTFTSILKACMAHCSTLNMVINQYMHILPTS